jgi:hypothetical protein
MECLGIDFHPNPDGFIERGKAFFCLDYLRADGKRSACLPLFAGART